MRRKPSKINVFRGTYLLVSIAVVAFSAFLFVRALVQAFDSGVMFDGTVQLIALLLCALFEVAIVLFIIRSIRFGQTILIKNVVFKQDGTKYLTGIIVSAVLGVSMLALFVLMLVSAFGSKFLGADTGVQLLIADVTLTMGVNMSFCFAYYLTFRRESGTFEII